MATLDLGDLKGIREYTVQATTNWTRHVGESGGMEILIMMQKPYLTQYGTTNNNGQV